MKDIPLTKRPPAPKFQGCAPNYGTQQIKLIIIKAAGIILSVKHFFSSHFQKLCNHFG